MSTSERKPVFERRRPASPRTIQVGVKMSGEELARLDALAERLGLAGQGARSEAVRHAVGACVLARFSPEEIATIDAAGLRLSLSTGRGRIGGRSEVLRLGVAALLRELDRENPAKSP